MRLCISDRGMIVRAGERFGSMIVPNGKAGLAMVSTSTIDGFLLSRGSVSANLAEWRRCLANYRS